MQSSATSTPTVSFNGRTYLFSRRKRILDIILSLVGLILFAPALALFGAAVKWADKGPVLFRQRRLGLNRREIEITKLRTMKDGAVTLPGRLLRKTGIDEITQFFDVLKGHMSIVGPRPLTRADVARLGWTGRTHDARFRMKPGITGTAQLFGGTSARHTFRLDLLYFKKASLWTDLKTIFWSFTVNLIGKRRVRHFLSRVRRPGRCSVPLDMRKAPSLPVSATNAAVELNTALLINPFYPKDPHSSFGKHVLTPSLAMTSIAAVTPAHWCITNWDENLLQGVAPSNPVPQVVGITVHLTFAKRAYALADRYRAMGSIVVLGGLHVMSCPDDAAPHADALAVGDGTLLWPKILTDVSCGTLKPRYDASFRGPFDAPCPERSILPKKSFLTEASINATRGCRNRCRFCYTATRGVHMPYRTRPVEEVAAEIKRTGESYAVFTDNNLGADRTYLKALCEALKPLEIIWSAAVSIDVTDDPSLIREMALSGCTGVFVGFETISEASLRATNKRTPPAEDYARRTALFHRNGIQVNGSFVFGFDGDGPDVFERTVEWIEENKLECATFHILTPYPGTPQFEEMEREGRLLHKDWSRYDTGHVVFRPKQMTEDDLRNGYAWTYKRLFSHASIWKRRPRDIRSVVPYLAMAYLYKKANRFWHFLIKHNLVKTVWSPLIAITRKRHLKFRKRLASMPLLPLAPESGPRNELRCETVVSAGV